MSVLREGVVGGAMNLYFIYKFLRILTSPWESTDAFKLGIVDEKGKILKKHNKLKTKEVKEAYTIMHRVVWKLKRLMEKIPFGKSRLASYAAALWLIKEEKEFHGTDEELQESFLTFLETDWKNNALILKEKYEGDMDKKTFSTLRKEGIDIKKSSMKDVIKDFQKSDAPQFKGKSDKKKKEMAVAAKLSKEEVDLDEKWAVGVVYHQEYKGGDRTYFRADSVQKNKRWKGKSVDEIGGKQKKAKNNTADERVQGWETTPEKEIPKGLKESFTSDYLKFAKAQRGQGPEPLKDWDADTTFQFIFVTIALTSVLVGIFFFILGTLKLGKLVRFIPYPVVGGFLAGTGWLIVKFAFIMTAGMGLSLDNVVSLFDQATLPKWFPALIFGLIMLISSRYTKHYLLIPALIAIGITSF